MKKNTTGRQIKNFADFLRGFGMLVAIVCGLFYFESNPIMFAVIILVGCFVAWASTLLLMGFGELIEDTAANRANTDRILFALESQFKPNQSEPTTSQTPLTWICKKCGTENRIDADRDVQFCRECGYQTQVYQENH